jgi:hypothetical protein
MTNVEAVESLKAKGYKPWKMPAHEWEALMEAEMGLTAAESAELDAAREKAADERLAKGEATLHAARLASQKP